MARPRNNPKNPGNMPDQWLKFCEHYAASRKRQESAIVAGYKEKRAKSIADNLLRKPVIQTLIAQLSESAQEKTGVTKEYILAELKSLHERARDAEEFPAAHNCLKTMGTHIGMFKDQEDKDMAVRVPIPPALSMDEFMLLVARVNRGKASDGGEEDDQGGPEVLN